MPGSPRGGLGSEVAPGVTPGLGPEGGSEIGDAAEGAICYKGLIRMRPISRRLSKDFLKLWIQSAHFRRQMEVAKTGATIQHFGPVHLKQMRIPVPPIQAQETAVEWASARLSALASQRAAIAKRIGHLREYRQSLITAAVTGQLHVPQEATA